MTYSRQSGRGALSMAAVVAAGLMLVGCQGAGRTLGSATVAEAAPEQITAEQLRSFCPQVQLREGTAFFNTYAGDPVAANVRYQAAITDVSRQCNYEGGQLRMIVAVAGKVVIGPQGAPGPLTLPVRVAALQGETVVYSEIRPYQVDLAAGAATQFLYRDEQIVLPASDARTIELFAGFDAGPSPTDQRVAAAAALDL